MVQSYPEASAEDRELGVLGLKVLGIVKAREVAVEGDAFPSSIHSLVIGLGVLTGNLKVLFDVLDGIPRAVADVIADDVLDPSRVLSLDKVFKVLDGTVCGRTGNDHPPAEVPKPGLGLDEDFLGRRLIEPDTMQTVTGMGSALLLVGLELNLSPVLKPD